MKKKTISYTGLFGDNIESAQKLTAAEKAHIRYILRFGKTDGKKCKHCVFLVVREFAGKYFKCAKFSTSGTPGHDWRVNWEACGQFQPSEHEKR